MSDTNDKKPQQPAGNAPRGSRRSQPTSTSSSASRPKRGSTATGAPRKYMTQQQKEAMYQRWLYIGLGIAAALIVLALGIGALWQYQIMPNQVLAKVNGVEITRRDYWEYQNVSLYKQARMYEDLALDYTGQEQSQFLLYASQLDAARKDVEGSTDVSEATLSQMIEDRLYIQAAEAQGVDMSNPVLQQEALNIFAPADSPVTTPIPSPTLIPERAEWATQTAEAQQTQEAELAAQLGTPMASPVLDGTPGATPVVEATPDMAVVTADAQSAYQSFLSDVLPGTGMSEQEFLDLFAKPEVARAHVDAAIVDSVPQSAPQVQVSHILVNTEELANQAYTAVSDGSVSFEDEAMAVSQDTSSSTNGGQLGWVSDGELPAEINDVIFGMQPGDISKPIQTSYGWHIVMVTDKDDDRSLTDAQYALAVTNATNTMLEEQRATSDISSDYYNPTPVPTAEVFTAPSGAPTPIVATPVAAPDLSATPVTGPVFEIATPQASPEASPAATPESTP